jgi:hypothetical protein
VLDLLEVCGSSLDFGDVGGCVLGGVVSPIACGLHNLGCVFDAFA